MNRLCKKCDSRYVEEGDLCEQCMSQSDSTTTRKDYAKAIAKMTAMVKSGEITNEEMLNSLKQMQQRHDQIKATMAKQDPTIPVIKGLSSAIKEVWQYAVFRWCVYFTPPFIFWFLAGAGAFASGSRRYASYRFGWERMPTVLVVLVWFLILTVPAVWVWRKPIWKAVGFLNKKAEE